MAQNYAEGDARQLPTSVDAGNIVKFGLTYHYDNGGNVDQILNNYFSGENRTNVQYDGVDRLTSVIGPWGNSLIGYDTAGNLNHQQLGAYEIWLNYSQNRLGSTTGSRSLTFAYDTGGLGNIVSNGLHDYVFNSASQLASTNCTGCSGATQVNYQYDGLGVRVSEQKGGNKTYFVQAPNGDLQFEYTPFGKYWAKHVYLHGKRIATESGSDAAVTTTTLSASPSPAPYGTAVALASVVSPAATGTVEFREGSQVVGSATLSSGQASFSVANLATGSHSIVAAYLGDMNDQPSSSAPLPLTINKRNASVVLAATPATGGLGQQATLSATVSGTGPTGQAQFFDGGTSLGTASLSNGVAGLVTSARGAGSHAFTATYLGDANHNSATSNVATSTVAQYAPGVPLNSSNANSALNEVVTFTATVNGVSTFVPTGTVVFKDGATTLGTIAVAGGSAALTTNSLAVGSHSITATYSGDSNYTSATSSILTQVVKALTTTTLSVAPLQVYAQVVSLTATVTGSAPTGTVHFQDGGVDIATASLSSGSAIVSVKLTLGTHTLRTVYDGDQNNRPSTSTNVPKIVKPWLNFNDD